MAKPPYSAKTRALIAASLGLPGMNELVAQEEPEAGFEYRFTWYDEEPLPADQLAAGDADRYVIKSHQFRLKQALGEDYQLTVDGLHESMSGSSPWFVVPEADSSPLQVMSGATISENRDELGLALTKMELDGSRSIGLAWSNENDYTSLAISYTRQKELSTGNTTVSWGGSFSDDSVSPSDAQLFGRVEHAKRRSASATIGLTRIINKNTVLQNGLQFTRQSGFLSDPYKLFWIEGRLRADSRPDERTMVSWSSRLRWYHSASKGALHADYRWFDDDWGSSAHTLQLAWHQPLRSGWELAPSIRFHSQSAAKFYAPGLLQQPSGIYYTSDYRQSSFGAVSSRIAATRRLAEWTFRINVDWYKSDESLGLSKERFGTPALVDFERFGLALERRW